MALAAGEKIGPYEIVSVVGAGGMGEVYLAQDNRLNRKVALKVLKETLSRDEQARSRFLKEAKAASALNNPHIVTVYDIISHQHSDVIVMEYMEGESLRALLSRGKLQITRALQIAADVAMALNSAHRAGIVHRDIKPENIVITKSNMIKVLDFGLAKLSAPEKDTEASQLSTASHLTGEGVVVGTVAYMSPEQAQGHAVDHRTDIFSLGVVLYEMLSGKRPFQGSSSLDTLHQILHMNPLQNGQLPISLPEEVQDVLSRTLAKNAEDRYQNAADFAFDLRRINKQIETGVFRSQAGLKPVSKNIWKYLVFALAIVTAGLAIVLWKSHQPVVQQDTPSIYKNITLTPLTVDSGYEWGPTFSPDGETIAYVSDRTGNFDIFLKQISGGPDINLTNNPADDVQPAFSPDGKKIAFVSTRSSETTLNYPTNEPVLIGGDIWVMSAFGGSPKKIVQSGYFPSWSPDGSKIIYTAGTWFRQKLFTISADGGTPEEVPVKLPPRAVGRFLFPVYSPSGKWIAFVTSNNVYILNPRNGEANTVLRGNCPVWLTKDKLVYSNSEPGKNYSLWVAPFSDETGKITGASQPLTMGRGRDLYPSASKDGSRIAFTTVDFSSNLEVMPFDADGRGAIGQPHQITSGNDIISFFNVSPDGKTVAFGSLRGVNGHIWRTDATGSEVQLTADSNYLDGYPRYSPDGKKIAFVRRPANDLKWEPKIWIMEADGASPQALGDNVGSSMFTWLPPDEIAFTSLKDGNIYAYSLTSHALRQITKEGHGLPPITTSLDGKWILYSSTIRGNVDVWTVSRDGGEPRLVGATKDQDYHPFVSPKGMWLYFLPDHKNLYRLPGQAQNWRSAEPEKVTNFPESGLSVEDPQLSQDGKQFLFSHANISGDIWLLTLK